MSLDFIANIATSNNSVPDYLQSQDKIAIVTDSDYQVLPDIGNKLISKKVEEGEKGQFDIFLSGELFLSKEAMGRFPTKEDIDDKLDSLDPYSG